MKPFTYRTAGHGLAAAPVNARTIAAARMAHAVAKREAPAPALSYLDAANVAQEGEGGGTVKKLIKAFGIALRFE